MTTRAIGIAATAVIAALGWYVPPAARIVDEETPLVGVSVASKEALVASEQPGKIDALPFVLGDRIEKGQVIFRLNSRLEQLEVERLLPIVESNLAVLRAELGLEHALQQEKRTRDLRNEQISSDADLQEKVVEVKLARLKLKQAQLEAGQARNQLAQAREKLDQRSVKSPFAGVVTQRFKSEGESVERFAPVVEVINLDPLWVEFDCHVTDQNKYRHGAAIEIAPAHNPLDKRTATIVFLSPKGEASSHTFMIRAEVSNRDLLWKSGQKMLIYPPAAEITEPAAKPGK